MKTKVRRVSKRTLAVLLGVLMLVSCLFVGTITTANAYSSQSGARFYLNAHNRWGDNVQNYVYLAIVRNENHYASIIKMDHIANTQLYTCVTTTDNMEAKDDVGYIFFFTSSNGGWATKMSDYKDNWYNNVNTYKGTGGKITTSYGMDVYNNHVYYMSINSGNDGVTIDGNEDNGNNLANVDSVTYLKSGIQKASVYISTNNGSSYSYANNRTKGGDVQVGGYGWSTAFETTSKTFATSSMNMTGSDSYSQYEKPVLTSKITMRVNEVFDGYLFQGWYNGSGTQLSSDETYEYRLTSNSAQDIQARFMAIPTYDTVGSPANTTTIPSGSIIFKKKTSTPASAYIWNYGTNYSSSSTKTLSAFGTSTTIYTTGALSFLASSATNPNYPKAIASKNATSSWSSGKLSGDITDSGSVPASRIWYYALNDKDGSNGNWTSFVHLGATGLTGNPTTADLHEEITLTATAPSTGTLSSGAKYNYYFSKDNGSTWYTIVENSSSETQKFYPPSYGSYTFRVVVADSENAEKVTATSSTTTTVGQEGFYVSGESTFISEGWVIAPQSGYMTTPSTGTIYTKTFGSVAAGSHEFRITSLTNWITNSSTHGTYTVDGEAGSMSGNNFTFSLSEKQQVTVTYDSSNHNVTVTTSEIKSVPVVVYSGANGSVEVTYGTATTDIPAGENVTVNVAYGDKITLTATPATGSSFSKWMKNMTAEYSTNATISGEVITKRTVYVARFGGSSGGSWIYSGDSSSATPEISGNTSGYNIIYSGSDSGVGRNEGTPNGYVATYKSGSDYWADLTSIFGNPPSTPNRLYIALANGTGNNNMVGDSSTQINGSTYTDGNGPTIKDSSDNTLFIARKKQNSTVNSTIRYIEIDGIDWSKISALGVRAVYSGSGAVNYKFYYKLTSGGSSEGDDYIPTTNYYAKDGVYRNNALVSHVSGIDTVVTPVEDEVTVTESGSAYKWNAGLALKGSTITVTTTIPDTGSYKATNSSGTTSTVTARTKYYVAGFSFNGVTPEILSERNDGVYTCSYTIPTEMKETMLEITPIIFIRSEYADNSVMIYLNGYNNEIKNAGWGNTLYLYPFYKYRNNNNNLNEEPNTTYNGQAESFGVYPGMPVINYGGQLYSQIPLTNDGTKDGTDGNNPIKGITINNGYYDYVHEHFCKHVSVHRQTYDYDDFAKIYNEKKTKNGSKYLYSIYFSFKYYAQNSTQQHRLATVTNGITGDSSASRNNDLLSSGNILNNTTGTVASTTLINAGENSTGWQNLTDALGNNVDIFGNKVTDASAEPLRVFSLGYENNNAGRWATEWAIYHKVGDNYVLITDPSSSGASGYSMSVPSALVMNSSASFANYSPMDGDISIQSYSGIYEALEAYAGVPVKICYEHDTPDAFGTKNYRCDGRWTYTTVDDYVRSNIKIEYYDKDGILRDDTFSSNSHEGTTTGCSAYFTNSEYYGETVSDSEIIDSSKSYTFKAENKGSYEFVGWYMYDTSGHESTITNSSTTADTPRSGNFVLAARFKYIADGNVTISNSLATGQAGRATTYLGVTMKNGDKETVLANVNSNTDPVKIDKSYINANSNYQIIVTIRTVPTGENIFSSYSCYTTNGSTGTDVRSAASDTDIYKSANSTHTTDTYTITVKGDIFDSTNTNQQNVKAIEYVSSLTAVKYTYNVKFNYTSRQYGDQAFTKTGELTTGQINDENVVTGTLNSNDKKLTKAFLAKIAPHESNFNTDISWNFDAVVNSQTCKYNLETNTYDISLTIANNQQVTTSNVARTAYFTVPYSQTNGVANADSEGKVTKTESTTFNFPVVYDSLVYTSGTNFVTAPEIIYDDEDELKFQYWKISTVNSSRGDSREIGKCFYPEFNYRILDNYNIEAIYSEPDAEDVKGFYQLYTENKFTTINFIGNSRNQWNSENKGTASKDAGDLIYNDFILCFKPAGTELFNTLPSGTTECGVVIQRLKEIETNSSGKNAKTLQEYAKDYSASDLSDAEEAANKYIADGTTTQGLTQTKRGINIANVNTKNRAHYTLPMYNSPGNGEVVGTNAKYLYRAYSYMKINGVTTLSDKPTYFYMYDIATL